MAFPTIGLAAIMDVKDFTKGEKVYTSGLADMNTKTESTAKRITGALKGIGKIALGVGVSAAGAFIGLGGTLLKLAADAAPVPLIAQSFTALGGSIEDLRAGSTGLITDVELMKSFNTAASLVSRDFAQKLPTAMEALGKVAASTGQDMGFLLNSLTTGVGRLSPMILDNLAIQVDLTKAYEDFASANGIVVKEMTKAQQQTALMNQVMGLLNENTKDLPAVTGTAAQQLGSLSVMFQNLKTDIGVAFLPVLQELLTPLSELAVIVLPKVVAIAQTMAETLVTKTLPAIRTLSRVFSQFIRDLKGDTSTLDAVLELLRFFIPEETILNAMRLARTIETTFMRIKNTIIGVFRDIQAVFRGLSADARFGGPKVWLWALGLSEESRVAIATAFTQIAARLRRGFDEVKRVVLGVFETFRTGDLRGGFKAALAKALEIGEVISTFRQKLITKLFEVGRTLLTTLGDMFPSIKPLVDDFLIPILNIGERTVNMFTKMKTDVRRVLVSMLGLIREPLEEIGKTFMSIMGNILRIVDRVWPSVLATIQRVVPAALKIIAGIMPIVRAVGNVLEKVLGDAIPFVLDLFAQMAEFIAEKMPQIQRVITKALAVIQIVWERVWPILQRAVEVVWGAIQGAIEIAIGVIEGVIDTFLSVLEGDWETAWDNVKELFVTWTTDMLKLAEDIVNNILKAFGVENFDLSDVISTAFDNAKQVIVDSVENWKKAGKEIIDGLMTGIDDALGGIKGLFERAIALLPKWARDILGAKSPSRVFAEIGIDMMKGLSEGIDVEQAQVIKKLTKAIGRIVNAFKQLVELQRDFQLAGGKLPDIGSFLDQFEAAIVAVLDRLDRIIEEVGEKRIKKIRKSAKRLREILDAVMIDLSKIALVEMPNLTDWANQVIDVTRAVLSVLGHLAFEFGTQAIEEAASWADSVREVLTIVKDGVDAIKALVSFEDVRGINFDEITDIFIERLDNVLEKLVKLSNDYDLVGADAAAQLFRAVQDIVSAVGPSVEAIASLLTFEDVPNANFDEITDIFIERLDNVLEKLIKLSGDYALDGTEAAGKMFAAMRDIVAIVTPGLEAIKGFLTFEDVPGVNFDEQTDMFVERLDNILEKLIPLAADFDLLGTEAAAKFFAAAQTIVGTVTPGLEAIKSLLSFEDMPGRNFDELTDIFEQRLGNIVEKLVALSGDFDIDATEAAARFAAAAQTIVGAVTPGLEAIKALLSFETIEGDIAEQAAEFATQIGIVVDQFQEAIEAVGVTVADDADKFWGTVQSIVNSVGPGIQALSSLMDFTRVKNLAEKAADFADDLAIVVTELDRVAQNFISMGKDGALSGLESADKFASAATTIVGVIDPAITALASLGTLAETNDLTGKLAIFKSQLNQVLIAIQGIAQGWAFGGGKQLLSRQSGLEAAETFAKAVGTISTGVKGAIDLIDEFMHYKGQTIAAGLAAFQQNLLQVRNMLTFEATEIEAVVPAANRFEAAMTTISNAVKAGIDLFAGLTGVDTGALAGIGARIRSALADVTAAFASETSTAAAAAYAYGFTVGRGASFGFRDGFASIPTPTFSVGAPAGGTGGSNTPTAPPAPQVNVNITGTTITSGMDAATFEARVTQAVTAALRTG